MVWLLVSEQRYVNVQTFCQVLEPGGEGSRNEPLGVDDASMVLEPSARKLQIWLQVHQDCVRRFSEEPKHDGVRHL
jgi:hypothetical protein